MSKLTYTDIKSQFLRNAAQSGVTSSTNPNLIADFNANLGQRLQLILSKMTDYKTQIAGTANTVADQQYYQYPLGLIITEACSVTVGSITYPLTTIYDQHSWDIQNAIQIQPTTYPAFIFPRKNDFGLWPIPQDVYTINLNYYPRYVDLLVDDYTDGTVTVADGSATVTGSSTTFTTGMVGRYFNITDSSINGYGQQYQIASWVSTTELTLSNYWQGNGTSGLAYRIGQCPEIPDEGGIILADGVTADFYFGLRNDPTTAQAWENKFYTGDRTSIARDFGNDNVAAGLIGLMNRYASRDSNKLITTQPQTNLYQFSIFGQTLSQS